MAISNTMASVSPTMTASSATPQAVGATGATGATGVHINPAAGLASSLTTPTAVSPTNVSVDPNILNSMGQYQNAAYDNQTSRLDPQWQQAQDQFNQQMVSQGLQPGSQAYDQAYQQFAQGKNDAYSQAYNNSFQTGLAAQGQAFGQGLSQSQLANALAVANINKAATTGAAGINANASMYNNNANNATNQLLGLGNLGLGYGQLQNQNNQTDLNTLLGVAGLNNGSTQYNNSLIGGAQNTAFGMIPNSNPSQVDVNGAYGINEGEQNTAYQGAVNSSNGTNQTLGELGTAAMMMMFM